MPRLHVPREARPEEVQNNQRGPHSPRSPRSSRDSHQPRDSYQPRPEKRSRPNQPSNPPDHTEPRRISTLQGHFIAASGEFVGTFMWLFFSFMCQVMLSTQASEVSRTNGRSSSQTNIFTALVYGLSLLVNVWAFFRISGGLFNPAVTFGMVIAGQLPAIRGLCLFPAQLLGAISAAALVSCIVPGNIKDTNTTLSAGTSIAQGVFIEMFMTAELVFVVLMLAAEKSKDTFLAPIGIGLALFVAMMGGVYFTGGSLNPARSFGPAVAGTQFPGYHWIYWVGPLLGGALAAGYFRFVKLFNYEQANPGQDSAGGDFIPQDIRRSLSRSQDPPNQV